MCIHTHQHTYQPAPMLISMRVADVLFDLHVVEDAIEMLYLALDLSTLIFCLCVLLCAAKIKDALLNILLGHVFHLLSCGWI